MTRKGGTDTSQIGERWVRSRGMASTGLDQDSVEEVSAGLEKKRLSEE